MFGEDLVFCLANTSWFMQRITVGHLETDLHMALGGALPT
jgi:hypothetical protein